MNENSYYISIQSTSLAHYIGKALILPSRFYKERPTDIQTIESDYIILSKEKFLNDSNCSIEIILNKQEIENLEQKNNNLFFYKNSIPISRIKKIFFTNEEQKILTISKINRDLGFISEKLIEIVDKQSGEVNVEFDNYKYSSELEEKIKTYNHILGGLSFVRYRLDNTYSKNYFSILSYFNKLIENELKKIEGYKIVDGYAGAFTGKGAWSELYPLLFKNINENDVLKFSKKEKIKIEELDGLWQYEEIENKSITYKLAILNNYGEDSTKRRKTKALIYDFEKMKIPKDKQEGISLIYGINNGYSAFYNTYDKKIVKFRMDSLLDYYTIESVFQYVINDKKNNERFEYIDYIGIEKDIVLNKEYETYIILDETIISDKKTIISRIKEWINERLFRELDMYIDNLFNMIKNLINEKKELVNNNMRLSQQLKKKEKELNSKNAEIQNLTTSKNQLFEQLNNKQREFENQSNELKNIQDKYNNETKLVEQLRKNEAEFKRKLDSKNIEIQNLTTSKNRLSEQLNNKQREFENQSNEFKNIEDKYKNKTKLVEELRENKLELKKQLDSKNIEIQNLTNFKNQLSEQLNNKQKEFENQSNELKNIVDKYNNETKLSEQLKKNEVELKRELENIQDKYNQENQELKHHINELENSNAQLSKQLEEKVEIKDNNLETFDEEKERIIIEQFLELYDKNTTELKKIAKGKGIKSTKKRELIKDILCHNDNNRLL